MAGKFGIGLDLAPEPGDLHVDRAGTEIGGAVEEVLRRSASRGIADPVPADVRSQYRLVTRSDAILGIHAPESMGQMVEARKRLVFDELLRVQLALVLRKRALEAVSQGIPHDSGRGLVQRFHADLPFALTGAQQRAIIEDPTGPFQYR